MSRQTVTFFLQLGSCVIKTTAKDQTRLATIIRSFGYSANFSECNYQMNCGKCLVSIQGLEETVSPEESNFLGKLGHSSEDVRCSCQVRVSEALAEKVVKPLI
jgi:ferredoxin